MGAINLGLATPAELVVLHGLYLGDVGVLPSGFEINMPVVYELLYHHVDQMSHLEELFETTPTNAVGGGNVAKLANMKVEIPFDDPRSGASPLLFGFGAGIVGTLVVTLGRQILYEIAIVVTSSFMTFWIDAMRSAKTHAVTGLARRGGIDRCQVRIMTSEGWGRGRHQGPRPRGGFQYKPRYGEGIHEEESIMEFRDQPSEWVDPQSSWLDWFNPFMGRGG